MKLTDIILKESQLGDKLAMGIYKAIDNIDPNLNYKDFASAVATVIKNEYGSHIIEPFMVELHKHLGLDEQADKANLEADLKAEVEKDFSQYSPYIHIGNYNQDRPDNDPLKGKGYGSISFRYKDSLPEDQWTKLEKVVKAHGGEITNSANWYDSEPKERDYYPNLKFNFDL